jgi:hypothetical protein
MLPAQTILGLWRKGPRASAFLITLIVCGAIFLAQMSGLLGDPIIATLIALLILFSLPIVTFVLSQRYDALSTEKNTSSKRRYNVIAWILSVLTIPFAVSISTFINSIYPNLVYLSKIATLIFFLIFLISLTFLYLSDSRSGSASVVEKISLPIALMSVSLYLGSDRHFSYFANIIPDGILSANALIRESVFIIATCFLAVVALFSKWEAFQGIDPGSSTQAPNGQLERSLRAFYDGIRYVWEFIIHFCTILKNALLSMFNLQNIILSIVASIVIYFGVLFAENLTNFSAFISNIFENNKKDTQNFVILALLLNGFQITLLTVVEFGMILIAIRR